MKNQPKLFSPPSDSWSEWVVNYITSEIEEVKKNRHVCNVVLAGGKTAQLVYEEWSKSIFNLDDVNFFMGDERCVPISHTDSNSGMVKKTLFKNGISPKSTFHPISYPWVNNEKYLADYALKIEKPDIILLGVGHDGHIASIFPGNFQVNDIACGYKLVESMCHNHKRVTIMPGNIKNCSRVIVLAKNKLKVYELANSQKINIPAMIVREKVWIL